MAPALWLLHILLHAEASEAVSGCFAICTWDLIRLRAFNVVCVDNSQTCNSSLLPTSELQSSTANFVSSLGYLVGTSTLTYARPSSGEFAQICSSHNLLTKQQLYFQVLRLKSLALNSYLHFLSVPTFVQQENMLAPSSKYT